MFKVIFVDNYGEEKELEKIFPQHDRKNYYTELQYINEFHLYFLLIFHYYIIFIFYNCSLNLLTEI
jgi:hypothetical protein